MKTVCKFLALGAFALSTQVQALSITDVGGVDTFLTSTKLANSGESVELAWVQDYLNDDSLTFNGKADSKDEMNWTQVQGTNQDDIYATSFGSEAPDYFLLKLGTGGIDIDSHYLFDNIGELSYGVVDFSKAGIDFTVKKINIGRVSHVSNIGGDSSVDVPAPASLSIFALALAGFAARRKLKA